MMISEDWRLPPGVYDVVLVEAEASGPGGVAFEFCICSGQLDGESICGHATTDELAEAVEADPGEDLEGYVGYGYEIEVGEDGISFYVRHFRSSERRQVPSAIDPARWREVGF